MFIRLSPMRYLLYDGIFCFMQYEFKVVLRKGHRVTLTNSAREGLEEFCVDIFAANNTRYDMTISIHVFTYYISWLHWKQTCTCVISHHLAFYNLFERHVWMEVSNNFSFSFEV